MIPIAIQASISMAPKARIRNHVIPHPLSSEFDFFVDLHGFVPGSVFVPWLISNLPRFLKFRLIFAQPFLISAKRTLSGVEMHFEFRTMFFTDRHLLDLQPSSKISSKIMAITATRITAPR
jgi:hypothetical protein